MRGSKAMRFDRRLKILILGLNYKPELVGIAVYTAGLAEALARRGHTVSVVAGKPYYPAWTVPPAYRGGWQRHSVENGVDVCQVAHYVPTNPTGLRRVLHHASFALSSLFPLLQRARAMRPDIVLSVAPSLIGAPVARLAAAVVRARSWLHIQDFEVEASIATGLVGSRGPGPMAARLFESFVLRSFDQLSSISPAMCKKLREKGIPASRVTEFRNWADLDGIEPLKGESAYRAAWGITTPHVALYSGNIANKQGIEIVISVARRLKDRRDLTFVVCGQGPNRASLERQASDLSNIQFHDLQPTQSLGELLGLASVHLLPQLASATDLVLPSKLANMLASGRPVVATALPGSGLANEVEGCGIVVPPEDEVAFAGAIETLLDDTAAHAAFCAEARRRALTRWQRDAIIDQFEAQLLRLVWPD